MAFARRFGRPFNALISGDKLLATVLHNPACEGVLVNSALAEVSVVIDRATAEAVALSLPADPVTVPPGHKVVVFRPAASPSFQRAESGVWIADLGAGNDFEPVLNEAERFVAAGHEGAIVWILQEVLLAQAADGDQFAARLEQVVHQPSSRTAHCAVLVLEAARRRDLIQRLKGLGMGVHGSANHGACFVEVHRPDGVVIGMPGPAL